MCQLSDQCSINVQLSVQYSTNFQHFVLSFTNVDLSFQCLSDVKLFILYPNNILHYIIAINFSLTWHTSFQFSLATNVSLSSHFCYRCSFSALCPICVQLLSRHFTNTQRCVVLPLTFISIFKTQMLHPSVARLRYMFCYIFHDYSMFSLMLK